MITLLKSEDRRHVRSGVHDTWMTFDPENRLDPLRRGFHALTSLNEENPAPEMGLYPHAPEDVEIITYVREGSLVHQDNSGTFGHLEAGEFQHTSARGGVRHRALNDSIIYTAHVFQSCITSGIGEGASVQEQKRFPIADREGILRLVVSPDGRQASLRIDQDVRMYSSVLLDGHHLIHELGRGRGAWLQIVKGRIVLRGHELRAGDGAALDDETSVSFTAREPAEILLFDLA
jgi:redox-sensitive bicupin YhaK (pirin superfamily)